MKALFLRVNDVYSSIQRAQATCDYCCIYVSMLSVALQWPKAGSPPHTLFWGCREVRCYYSKTIV